MMKRMTWLLLIAFLTNHMTWALPRAEAANPNEMLQFGRLQFYAGNYAESLDKLNKAIKNGNLSLEELASAYLLKARCEARRDKKGNAVKAFCKMYETEFPIVVSRSDFSATEMKAYREATEKCAPEPSSAPQQTAPAPQQTAPVQQQAPVPAETQAAVPGPVTTAPVQTTPVVVPPVQTAPVAVAPAEAAQSGKRWYQKPFSWIFSAGVVGLVYLLATNDSDRVLADPDER